MINGDELMLKSDLDIHVDDDGKEICPFCNRSFATGVKSHLERNASCNKKFEAKKKMEMVDDTPSTNDELEDALKEALNDAKMVEDVVDELNVDGDDDVVKMLETKSKRIKYVRDLPFDEIDGFGPKKTEKVKKWMDEQGYILTKQLAAAKVEEIKKIQGIDKEARKILNLAMTHAGRKYMTRAIDILADYELLTTGILDFDDILHGGLRTGGSYVGFGPFRTGKTAFAQQLAANLQLDKEKGGLHDPNDPTDPPICLWFDTEGTSDAIMSPEKSKDDVKKSKTSRFRDIAYWTFKRHYEQGNDESDDEYEARALAFQRRVLINTLVTEVPNTDDQVAQIEELIQDMDELGNVKLVVVDSLINRFRSEFIGRGTLAPRQQLLNQYIHKLHQFCGKDVILFVTNQVQDKPDSFGYGLPFKEVGGNIVQHNLDVHLQMRRGQKGSINIKIIDAAGLPPEDCNVKLTDKGLESLD